jgi:hypothetical protein
MFDLGDSIYAFLETFNEVWLENKRKEFKMNPLHNSKRNLIWVYDGYFDYNPVYEFDLRTKEKIPVATIPKKKLEKYNLKRFCIEYYNRSNFYNTDNELYEWLGLNEMERSGKPTIKPMTYNVKMLVNVYLNNLNDYFIGSLTSKGGIIYRIKEFKDVLNEEIKKYLITIDTKPNELKYIIHDIKSIFINCLDNKYGQFVESHSRPNHSKLMLDFDLNRTELVAMIYLLFKSGFLKDTKENRDFCIEYFTFKMKNIPNNFSSDTNFTNLMGEIKKEKSGDKYVSLDEVMTDLQDVIFKIKSSR